MSDILVTSPYRPFTLPNQFKAVFNGYIYCGTVDAVDPSVSPVQVYLVNESGDKVPVAQPLRTNAGGFLVYNGQPAKFVTDSNHSLLVRDSLGNQVWYEPDMASADPETLRDDIYDNFTRVFDSVADMKAATNMKEGQSAKTLGYYRAGDGGGGDFYWDIDSTDDDDGGYTIAPTTVPPQGRWKRDPASAQGHGVVSPLEFGAKLNDPSFDSSFAINKAISYLNPYLDASYDSAPGGDVIIPTGKLYINNTIYGAPNVRLLGVGGQPGFRSSSEGCAIIKAMAGMDPVKVMYDTAPYLNDGSGRYTNTNEMIYGRTESNGYYGVQMKNLVFSGNADTQAAVRIWRVPVSKLENVAVYGCKVSYWLNGSWDVTLRDCFAYNAKYATVLVYQCTAINIFGGYFSGNTAFPWSSATQQWFHRGVSASNPSSIAFTTTMLYTYNTFDINLFGVTAEGYNRPFALFYSRNVNLFGGYYEHLNPATSEDGHRVFVQSQASVFISTGSYFNNVSMDLAFQAGNTSDSAGYIDSERSQIKIINPKIVTKFLELTKGLGYGEYNISVDSPDPITQTLNTTLFAQRLGNVRFDGLERIYTYRQPAISQNGGTSFSFSINNTVSGMEYALRFVARNTQTTVHQDARFNVLTGATTTVTKYEGRSIAGTTVFTAPTATYANNTLTVTFLGNWDFYSIYRVECVPRENLSSFSF